MAAFRAMRAARLAELSGSSKSAAAISEWSSQGRLSLATAKTLSDSDRISVAEKLLGRTLSQEQRDALISAHKIGQSEGKGYLTYTDEQLREKAQLLRSVGFTSRERSILMRNGIAGSSLTSSEVAASMSQTKTFKMLSPYEQQSRLKNLTLRDQALRDVEKDAGTYSSMSAEDKSKYMTSVRALGDASRIAGETAGSVGDLKSAQVLTRDALARYEKVLKEKPGLLDSSLSRENLLDLRVRAGDTEGAAKSFVDNAKRDYAQNGFQNPESAMSAKYQELKQLAEAGPPRSVLEGEKSQNVYLSSGRPVQVTNASQYYLNQIRELQLMQKIVESKPSWLNVSTSQEQARIQSMINSAKQALQNRGYNFDELLK
jgi:hypothetical protein